MSSVPSIKMTRRLLFTSSGLVVYLLFFGKILSNGQLVNRGELSNTINSTAYLVLGLNPNKKQESRLLLFDRQIFSPSMQNKQYFRENGRLLSLSHTLRYTKNQHLINIKLPNPRLCFCFSSHHQMHGISMFVLFSFILET